MNVIFQVPKITEGTLQTVEFESVEFSNEFFIRGREELLKHIRRKYTKVSTT